MSWVINDKIILFFVNSNFKMKDHIFSNVRLFKHKIIDFKKQYAINSPYRSNYYTLIKSYLKNRVKIIEKCRNISNF